MNINPSSSDNVVLPFQVGESAVRGRVVRLGSAVDEILQAHQFDEPVSELLGEAGVLAALMGSALKFDGKLIFQAKGSGPVTMLVADYAANGAVRATASHGPFTQEQTAARGLRRLMGEGHIAITIDQGPDMDRYQGVTPIEGERLEEAAITYFSQSEQIPTAMRLAVGRITTPGSPTRWRAGGIMAQFVPDEGGIQKTDPAEGSELWERAAALLQTTKADELLDPAVSPETLLYRLFHEDGVRVFEEKPVRAQCDCNSEKIESVLSRYTAQDLEEMIEGDAIRVSCEFCRAEYFFDETGKALERT